MKYLTINPFNPDESNGVNSYYESLADALSPTMEIVEFSNRKGEDIATFQRSVLAFVKENFFREDVIIEAPETRAATLLLDRTYKTHIRLHTPLATCHKYEGKSIDQSRFSQELRVISQAAAVSAPSYGIEREIQHHLDTSKFIVNKNPISKKIPYLNKENRRYDAIFMGRFNAMKGVEYLDAFLELFPRDFKVALVGTGATKFRLRNSDKVAFVSDHINGDERFMLLANAKTCMVPSLFENCSMMILEAIAAGVPVVTWRRGGNDEFPEDVVKTVDFDQIEAYASAVVDAAANTNISQERAVEIVNQLNEDFLAGVRNVIQRLSANPPPPPHRSEFRARPTKIDNVNRPFSFEPESFFAEKRVLGFTVSNEHIEEMWAPVLNFLGVDYRFVCRRPLGFHSKFGERHVVKDGSFIQHDWVKNPKRLIEIIASYKPNILLTHNGSHPMYQHIIKELKQFNLPIVFSELGWFPQNGNIYFDRWGVNGGSSLASLNFKALTGRELSAVTQYKVKSRDLFIAGQLNNDTNLKVFSPRFKSIDDFIAHIVSQLAEDRKIYIKPHPLDSDAKRFDALRSSNVEVVSNDIPIPELLNKVGHVFAVNSTVLFEALEYDVNLYSGGLSLLDNKGVSRSLLDKDAKDVISEDLFGSRIDRNAVISAFKQRQINVSSFGARSLIDEGQIDQSLNPLVEALLISRPRWPVAAPTPPVTAAIKPVEAKQPAGLTYTQLYKRGCDHFYAQRYSQAANDFMNAAKIAGSGPNVYRCAAEAYVRLGDISKAIQALEASAKLQPKNKRLSQRIAYLKKPKWLQRLSKSEEFEVMRP